MTELLEVPQGSFELERHPPAGRRPLRAWDAADDHLLHHLQDRAIDAARTVVVNDAFGALAVGLCGPEGRPPLHFGDSHVSVLAARANLQRNGRDPGALVVRSGTGAFSAPGEGLDDRSADLVVIKIPKSLGLLEDQLHRLRTVIAADTEVVAAAMTRHLHTSTLERFEAILGPTRTSLARRKARLVHCTPDPGIDPGPSPWPREYRLADGTVVVNHAGVHAAGRLDPGTRFFLEHLPADGIDGAVLDLGCGDGIVGTTIALVSPAAELHFVDESHLAVASAEATFGRNLGPGRAARFVVADVLERSPGVGAFEPASVDLVLLNPPFHADHALGDETAWRMMQQARRVLRPGGEIRVVGNRHLAHHARLNRVFGNSEVVASDPRFVVCRSVRT